MPTSQQAMQILAPALEGNNIMTAINTVWGPAAIGPLSLRFIATLSGFNLNDADNAAGGVLCLPKNGTITDVGCYVSAVTGILPAYNIGIVTIDASGFPTTTAYGGSTSTTITPASTGWKWATLAGNATSVAGDFAAVLIWPTASAPNGSNYATVIISVIGPAGHTYQYTTAGTVSAGTSLFAVKYDDGTIAGIALSTNTISSAVTSATTPDEVGCVFTLPAAIPTIGIRTAAASYGTAAAYDFVLYDSSDNVLRSTSVADKDYIDTSDYIDVYFDGINLIPGATYRITVKPTVGTNGTITPQRYQFESAAARAAWPHGDGSWMWTYRTDGGAWTDDELSLGYFGLLVSGIEFTSQYGFSG